MDTWPFNQYFLLKSIDLIGHRGLQKRQHNILEMLKIVKKQGLMYYVRLGYLQGQRTTLSKNMQNLIPL